MLTQEDFKYLDSVIEDIIKQSKDLTRIYISGPVSKYNDDNYAFKIFDNKEQELYQLYNKEQNYVYIINPTKVNMALPSYNKGTLDWGDFMCVDMMLLSLCDKIHMLDGWQESSGATFEYKYAKLNYIKIVE